jgi:hypothetical protein
VAAGTSGGGAGTSGRRDDVVFIGLIAGMLASLAVVNALSVAHDWTARGHPLPFWEPLAWETTSVVVLMALAPLSMVFTRRVWPLDPSWRRALALHLLALVAFSLLHVTGMGALRWAIYAAVGDAYSPLGPLADFPYEFRKDALVYAGFVFLYVAWRKNRASWTPAGEAAPDSLEVRDGARRHFVPLCEVAWIEAAGNYVELHRGQAAILHRAPLSEMERQLQGAGFVRIHRSRLVRRGAVAHVESKPSGDYVVRLADGRELAGSRRYRRPLLEP